MSKPETFSEVLAECAPDMLANTALEHPKTRAFLAAAPGMIRDQLVTHCLMTEATAHEVAAALTIEAVDPVVEAMKGVACRPSSIR